MSKIMQGKTAAGLVAHCQRALGEKWWYVWGTFGTQLTQSLLDQKAKQYPTYNGGANYAVHTRHLGETVSDCVGLIKSYYWWDDAKDKPLYQASSDVNTGGMYNLATERGVIGTIPELPGVCVYMQGHIGVYIGGGWVIECAGGRGVVRTPLTGPGATRWTHWLKCPYLSYARDQDCPDKPNPDTGGVQVGDWVRVRPGAGTYTGARLASWVYSTTYQVMGVSGDRVVIGDGKTVTAAVKAGDLVV